MYPATTSGLVLGHAVECRTADLVLERADGLPGEAGDGAEGVPALERSGLSRTERRGGCDEFLYGFKPGLTLCVRVKYHWRTC
jgi:hypothetical protein